MIIIDKDDNDDYVDNIMMKLSKVHGPYSS